MKPPSWFDIVVAFALGFLSAGPELALPSVPWVWPIGAKAPFKADKLSVLVVEETEQEQNLTEGQRTALHSYKPGSLLDYLKTHGEWRILDKDNDPSKEVEPWKSAFAAAKKDKLPAACISNGRSGYNGPLPETEAEIIALVKKYGGA